MSSQIARIGIAAIAALTLAACVDDQELFAPPTPDAVDVAHDFTIEIPGPDDFVAITAGEYHTCALRSNGTVFCWGTEGGPAGIAKPMEVPTLWFKDAIMIDAGASHTCALDTARAAHCWGAGHAGQLGLGNGLYTTHSYGDRVAPPIGSTTPLAFNTLSAGGHSTCGLAPSGVFCWGEQGDVTGASTGLGAPVQISTFNGFTSVAVGNRHSCGRFGLDVYCWGANNVGQSGVDPANAIFHPGTTMLFFAQTSSFRADVSRISTQNDFTCADMRDGFVECFGNGSAGQTGRIVKSDHRARRVGDLPLHSVSTGTAHACALDRRNNAFCWGSNVYGQLGNNASSFGPTPTPVAVTGGHTYKALAAGRNHTCAIGEDKHIYCWGQNNYRQLGTWISANGQVVTNGFSPNPVLVM